MKKTSLLVLGAIMLLLSGNMFAQVVEDEGESEIRDSFYEYANKNKARKPFDYPFVRDADVVWKTTVWRVVDFREKMNQPYYYPRVGDADPNIGLQGRANLYTVLDQALLDGVIKCYEDDEFKVEIDYKELKAKAGGETVMTTYEENLDGDPIEKETVVQTAMNPDDVLSMRIKENWYIDKQRSVRDVRIIGFCLLYKRPTKDGTGTENYRLGWIRYNDPEVRNLLANAEMYNPKNEVFRPSYDDAFVKRLFTSYIIRVEDTYNRSISDYLTGVDALLESQRIDEEIFNREQDMWEY